MRVQNIQVLLIEDNPGDVLLIRSLLSATTLREFIVDVASSLKESISYLKEKHPTIILLDLSLPDSEGFQTLERIQAAVPDIPIVILTGQEDEFFALGSLQKGVQDYLIKGRIDTDSVARSLLFSIERRQLQDNLRRNENRLAEAQALAHVGSWELDLIKNTVDWSDELFRLFGLNSSEYIPTENSYHEAVHPDDRKFVQEYIENIHYKNNPVEFNHRLLRKDGKTLHVRTRVQAMLDKYQKPIRLLGTCHDITDHKKLEEQILFAGRMASVGTLASGVAHEINNPLTYILGNVDFTIKLVSEIFSRLEKGQEMAAIHPTASADALWGVLGGAEIINKLDESKEALTEATVGVERVRNVTRDLKIFSRSEEEHQGPVLITKVLESAINMSYNEIRHRARLIKDFTNVPTVQGNESRLGQVFLNLLVNAAQAIPEGRAYSNEIRVCSYFNPKGTVVIEIKDTGCGIKPEVLERIFEPFFTTKPVGVGTGLGLSICRSIIVAHGGEIEAESEVGKGSLFRVMLPASQVVQKPGRTLSPGYSSVRRGRILLIDDEASILKVIHRTFADEHEIVARTKAIEALELLLGNEEFDVILCDLMMPDLTGKDLYEELSKIKPHITEKIIFLSGGAFTPRAREFLESVPNNRLEKPVDMRSLRALIQTMLR
jgi:PAS domain S-box-containing protein